MGAKRFRNFLTGGLKNKKETTPKKDWEIVDNEDGVTAMTGFGDAELENKEDVKAPIDRGEMEKEIEQMGYGTREEPIHEFKRVKNVEESEKVSPRYDSSDHDQDDYINDVLAKSAQNNAYQEPKVNNVTQNIWEQPKEEVAETPLFVEEKTIKEEPVMHNTNDYSNPYSVNNDSVIIEHEPKTVIASGLIANAVDVSPAELGLSNNLHVKKIQFNFTDCEPIELDAINDDEGYICNRLVALENKYGVSVLPLDLCGIPNNVMQIKDHKIIEIDGRKFASGTNRVVNNEDYGSLLAKTKSSLQKLNPIEIHLLQKKSLNGFTFTAPILNEFELNQFISKCRNFKPEVYFVSNGDIVIKFGVFNAKI